MEEKVTVGTTETCIYCAHNYPLHDPECPYYEKGAEQE